MNLLFTSVIETISHVHIFTRTRVQIVVKSINKTTGEHAEFRWNKFIDVNISDGLSGSELVIKQMERHETYITLGRKLITIIFEGAGDHTLKHYSLISMGMLLSKIPNNHLVNMQYVNITGYNAYAAHSHLEIPTYPQDEQSNYMLHICTAWKSLINGIRKYASSPQIADMILKHIFSKLGIYEHPNESVVVKITNSNNKENPNVTLFRRRGDLLTNLRDFMFYQKLSTTIIDTIVTNMQRTPCIMQMDRGVISAFYFNESLLEYAIELSKLFGIDNQLITHNLDNISTDIKYELLNIIYTFGDLLNEIDEAEWIPVRRFM